MHPGSFRQVKNVLKPQPVKFCSRHQRTMLQTSRILRLLISTLDGPKYEPSSLVPLRYSYVTSTCTSMQQAHSMLYDCGYGLQSRGPFICPRVTQGTA